MADEIRKEDLNRIENRLENFQTNFNQWSREVDGKLEGVRERLLSLRTVVYSAIGGGVLFFLAISGGGFQLFTSVNTRIDNLRTRAGVQTFDWGGKLAARPVLEEPWFVYERGLGFGVMGYPLDSGSP